MAKKPRSTISHPLTPLRPWLTGRAREILTLPNVLHADLLAYQYGSGGVAFSIAYHSRGRVLIAQDWFAYVDGALYAVEREGLGDLSPLHWTRQSHWAFAPCHGALLAKAREAQAVTGAGYVSVLAHYVPRPDADPWPRGWVNLYGRHGTGALGVLPDLL